MSDTPLTTRQKALALNLAAKWYGSVAEIGGGQEVARWFFKVGGAAGTVAKTISAYDMAISDGIYGQAKRYVSRERLNAMLEHEFAQLSDQLRQKHGDSKCFFAFANTVATRRFHNPEHGRGWIGMPNPWQHLHRLLRELGRVASIRPSNEAWLSIQPADVMTLIERGDPLWKTMVPAKVAAIIESEGLFGSIGVAPHAAAAELRRPGIGTA